MNAHAALNVEPCFRYLRAKHGELYKLQSVNAVRLAQPFWLDPPASAVIPSRPMHSTIRFTTTGMTMTTTSRRRQPLLRFG